jgi:CheY-like chemotaxis protein
MTAGDQSKGLKGRLEDLALLDILQIIAFSRKTGYLSVEGALGRGALVFRDGLIVCASSWSTGSYLRQIASGDYRGDLDQIIRQQVELSLRELTTLREGAFFFQLCDTITSELGGIDISAFLSRAGVDPQHLLLEMAKDLDEEREDTALLVEPEPAPEVRTSVKTSDTTPEPQPVPAEIAPPELMPEPSPLFEQRQQSQQTLTVVLVDDEPEIIESVGNELKRRGLRVWTASGPADGAALACRHAQAGEPVVVVCDLNMLSSTGRNFYGGFELVRRLKKNGLDLPVLLTTERLPDKARQRARELGIAKVAFKPSISKLDAEDYRADLRAFAGALMRHLCGLTTGVPPRPAEERPVPPQSEPSGEPGNRAEEEEQDPLLLDFITSMTEQLVSPQRSLDISRMVLQVASKYFERGILFLVQEDSARGMGGFGLATTESASAEMARNLVIHLKEAQPLARVIQTRKALRLGEDVDGLQGSLFTRIGRGRSREGALLPMLNSRDVLTVLYGDNPASGKPVGKLRGLEIFIAQAGIALENVFLHKKLKNFESNLSPSGALGAKGE